MLEQLPSARRVREGYSVRLPAYGPAAGALLEAYGLPGFTRS